MQKIILSESVALSLFAVRHWKTELLDQENARNLANAYIASEHKDFKFMVTSSTKSHVEVDGIPLVLEIKMPHQVRIPVDEETGKKKIKLVSSTAYEPELLTSTTEDMQNLVEVFVTTNKGEEEFWEFFKDRGSSYVTVNSTDVLKALS